MQKMRHTRLNSLGVRAPWGPGAMGPLYEAQDSSHHPVQDWDSPIPGHHCGCCSHGGRGSCPTVWAPQQLWGPLSLWVQEILWGCNPSLSWHLFQTLLWLVCALRVIFLLHLTLRQIDFLTAVATPTLNPAWTKHMSQSTSRTNWLSQHVIEKTYQKYFSENIPGILKL